MTFARIFCLLQGIGFILFGLYCFFSPERMIEILGAPSMSGDGVYEMRGIYGGVSFGIGLLALFGGIKADLRKAALLGLLAYTGGYGLARIAALPLDGFPGGNFPYFAAFEIVTALICIYLLRQS